MKTFTTSALILALGLTLSANAAEKAAPSSAPAAPKAAVVKAMKYRGTIESVDAIGGTFTVKGKMDSQTFSILAANEGGTIKAESLKAGDNVAVSYHEMDGKNMADKVSSPVTKKPMAPAKPAAK